MPHMRVAVVAAAVGALIVVGVVLRAGGGSNRVGVDAGGLAVRQMSSKAPDVGGQGLDGQEHAIADARGHVLVVNVWATWCGPCQDELPTIVRTAHTYAGRGVRFLGLDYADDSAQAREWVRSYGMPYPSISDPSGRFADDLGFVGLPDTYIVDRTGTIRYWLAGAIDDPAKEKMFTGLLDEVLAAPSSSGAAATPAASSGSG
jgi:cytochrome c biogenesis protein CcmG, thiol:disulfide interchange protein DsbE